MAETLRKKETKWLNFGKSEEKIMQFIQNSDQLTETEKQQIETELHGKDMKEIFRLITIIFSWSSIALLIDSTLNSIIGTTAIATKSFKLSYFLPTIIFSSVDYLIKFNFLRWRFHHLLTRAQAAKSAIPTIGPVFLINELFKDSPVFAKALKLYLTESNPIKRLAKNISNRVKNVLGRSEKNPTLAIA